MRTLPALVARVCEVLRVSLYLGLTSFGGPIAHLGYFERVYVRQRRWLTGEQFGALVALCQMLPGPASSQASFLIGFHRAGWPGALAAWLGFTLPSAVLLFGCAAFAAQVAGPWADAGIHGLKLLAVAVVAQAVWSMARRLCTDRVTAGLALISAVLLLAFGGVQLQLAALAIGALGGVLLRREARHADTMRVATVSPAMAWSALAAFLVLLLGLPLAASRAPHGVLALADIFYRAGALVFGGGHVVLPLLRDGLVPGGWLSDDQFLVGYGLAQAVPGPLFTVAAYLGATVSSDAPSAMSALVATVFIFLPGMLIAVAGAVLWHRLGDHRAIRSALVGINAAVVGILAAAFYDPVWTSAVHTGSDVAIALTGLLLLARWQRSPLVVLLMCVGAAEIQAFAHCCSPLVH